MTPVLEFLPRTVPADPGRPKLADDRRPIREITRQIAFEPGGWTPARAAHVAAMFDGLAPCWHERPAARRHEAVDDALARGGPYPSGPCLEVGSGTGLVTPRLAARFSPLVSMDLSPGMLALASPDTFRLQADSSTLPVRDGAAAVVALVNMFLFPAEIARVLAPGGVVVWVNTLGDATPIHLPAADVAAVLPGDWHGVAADAGWGTWATFRRAAA